MSSLSCVLGMFGRQRQDEPGRHGDGGAGDGSSSSSAAAAAAATDGAKLNGHANHNGTKHNNNRRLLFRLKNNNSKSQPNNNHNHNNHADHNNNNNHLHPHHHHHHHHHHDHDHSSPGNPMPDWGYSTNDGPDCWPEHFPAGKGEQQSPIDIDTLASYVRFDGTLNRLTLHYERCKTSNIFNNGHSFQVRFDTDTPATLSGGPLVESYQLVQFHAHWGQSNNAHGSEHTVNGRSFPAEMHFVHFNKAKYGTIDEALQHPDGLAVLSVFLKVSSMRSHRNKDFQKLIEDFDLIDYDNHDAELDFSLNPRALIPPDTSRFFTYPGSLTTPPLSECVIWIIMADPLEVSDDQLAHFHSLHNPLDGHLIDHNYRPVMPINDRVVRASFRTYSSTNYAPIPD